MEMAEFMTSGSSATTGAIPASAATDQRMLRILLPIDLYSALLNIQIDHL